MVCLPVVSSSTTLGASSNTEVEEWRRLVESTKLGAMVLNVLMDGVLSLGNSFGS